VLEGEFVGWLGFVEDGGPFYRGAVGSKCQNKYGQSTIMRLFCYLDHRSGVWRVPEMDIMAVGRRSFAIGRRLWSVAEEDSAS